MKNVTYKDTNGTFIDKRSNFIHVLVERHAPFRALEMVYPVIT